MNFATAVLYFMTATAVVLGLGVSIWSIIDTNKKYPSNPRKMPDRHSARKAGGDEQR